ncbi:hypothetical protein GCM10023229_31950 [Flavisolibacter ginsenosidimutans]
MQAANGDCLPKTVSGTYTATKPLNDSNFIEVSVNVQAAGTYTIATDTVNGFSFKTTGTFSSTGTTTVRLKGTGTPAAAGTANFTVSYGATTCRIAITVVPLGAPSSQANFTLVGSGGGCSVTPEGNYIKDSTLNTTNRVGVQVNVTSVGTYSITTNTVNGYTFSGTGTFSTTGTQTVYLQGSGKPQAAKADNFTVTAGSSTCTFSITVTAGAPSAATFTLAGSPNGCGNFSVQGTYQAGTALGSSNTVTFGVNVTVPGSYTISTNTANGVSFSRTGSFSTTGAQTVVLNGSGTPAAAGNTSFTVTAGSSTCTFSVTVASTPPPPTGTGTYLPLTLNSWWSYNWTDNSGSVQPDSLELRNRSTFSYNGKTYTRTSMFSQRWFNDTLNFAKVGNDYYLYLDDIANSYLDFYADSTNPKGTEVIVLKDNMPAGSVWNSTPYTVWSGGAQFQHRYQTRQLTVNTSEVVNGVTYQNVIWAQVAMQIYEPALSGFKDFYIYDFYFAKDIGIIKQMAYPHGLPQYFDYLWELRNYKVF